MSRPVATTHISNGDGYRYRCFMSRHIVLTSQRDRSTALNILQTITRRPVAGERQASLHKACRSTVPAPPPLAPPLPYPAPDQQRRDLLHFYLYTFTFTFLHDSSVSPKRFKVDLTRSVIVKFSNDLGSSSSAQSAVVLWLSDHQAGGGVGEGRGKWYGRLAVGQCGCRVVVAVRRPVASPAGHTAVSQQRDQWWPRLRTKGSRGGRVPPVECVGACVWWHPSPTDALLLTDR